MLIHLSLPCGISRPVRSNGNDFHFAALGATSPSLWHKLAIYLIAMREDTNEVLFNLKSPGLGSGATLPVGLGVAWQPNSRLLFGTRVLLNNDEEQRTDPRGVSQGLARSAEVRLGGSVAPWTGALIDIGGTRLEKKNSIADSHVRNMARSRVGGLFGERSDSVVATFTLDYNALRNRH